MNPTSLLSLFALFAAIGALVSSRRHPAAKRCVRCGRPFCHLCKSGREANDYCTQCVHLFVVGDGLAPETKTRKLYEIDRHDRWSRLIRRSASLLLPGAGDVLGGRPVAGALLLLLWLSAWLAWVPEVFAPLQHFLGADLRLDLLQAAGSRATSGFSPAGLISALLVFAVWLAGNLGRGRRSEA